MNWLSELDKEGKKYRNATSKEKETAEKSLYLTSGKKLRSCGCGRDMARGKGKGNRCTI